MTRSHVKASPWPRVGSPSLPDQKLLWKSRPFTVFSPCRTAEGMRFKELTVGMLTDNRRKCAFFFLFGVGCFL